MDSQGDRNLVFGILALQLGFVSRDQLVAVASAWMQDTSRPLSRMLLEQGVLQDDTCSLLETLVERHLRMHGNDPQRSLAALENSSDCRACLSELRSKDPRGGPGTDVTSEFAPSKPSGAPGGFDVTMDSGVASGGGSGDGSRQDPANERLPGGRFRVVRPHAQGGLGIVSIAVDEELHREVAFKELLKRRVQDEGARARLMLEAEITGSLEHPGVVPVYGLGQHADGRPFYAMRFIRGETLREAIDQYHGEASQRRVAPHGSLDFRRLLNHFVATCNVIEYAHSRGIIHRDLKPENIMLGNYGETLVVDWGLAKPLVVGSGAVGSGGSETTVSLVRPMKSADVAETQMGSVVGTPAFMSPEQARGNIDQLSPSTDIYSLGATLFYLLTKQRPVSGGDALEVVTRVAAGDIPRARDVHGRVPRALEAICTRAMALEPQDRYGSALLLAGDIENWLADEPVWAHGENVWQRLGRWSRRHRAWTRAGAVALVLVAGVLSVATILVNRARHEAIELAEQNDELATREHLAKQEAVTRLREARQAVDTWLTGMSDALQFYPGMQEARRRLLEQAARKYQEFAEQPASDAALRLEQGRASQRLGDVLVSLRQMDEALRVYQAAVGQFASLFAETTLAADAMVEWSSSQNRLGLTLAEMGDHAAAEKAYQAGLEKLAQLNAADQQRPEAAESLGILRTNLGTLFLTLGRSSEARDQFALAGATFEGLVRQDAQEPRFQSLQAAVQSQAARLELAVGNLDAARRSWEASLEVLDRLVSRFSDQPVYLETRAASRLQMAGLLRLLGRYDEEVRFYRDVIADYLALQKALPDVPAYRENLALTQTDLGQAWRDLGRNEDAQAVLEQAAPVLHELVLEYPAVPRYDETLAACRDILAQVLLDLNRADEARTKAEAACEAYRRLNSRFPDVPEYRERAAIAQSHLGQVQHRLGESEARASFESSLRDLEELAQRNPNYRVYRLEQAHVWQNLGNWYVDSHDMAQADKAFLAARKLWEELASDETPDAIYNLCRLLLLCPLESVRDIPRGVQLTERLRQLVPDNQHYRSLRAAAHLRAGEFAVAAEELQHLTTEREFDAPQDWFLLCLAQVGMGRAVEAKASFDRGCTSMERAAPGSLELQRLRQEALAALPQP